MPIRADVDLTAANTLALPARAQWYCEAGSVAELAAGLAEAKRQGWPVQLLGGGSNVILDAFLPGLTLRPRLRGRALSPAGNGGWTLHLGAGEDWHSAVTWCLAQGAHGLENLALIPGWAGAAPVQNIGAYGVELCERLAYVDVFDRTTAECRRLLPGDCQFGYRTSLFKQAPELFVITAVGFTLQSEGVVRADYPALAAALAGAEPTPQAVFDAVCRVRRARLPDPVELPNCGSFFKNPVVAERLWQDLKQQWPELTHYPAGPDRVKLAAGQLIDLAGWKGKTVGPVGVHAQQALVLVNYGGADRATLLAFAADIAADIEARFGIRLEREPVCLPAAP